MASCGDNGCPDVSILLFYCAYNLQLFAAGTGNVAISFHLYGLDIIIFLHAIIFCLVLSYSRFNQASVSVF